MTALAELREFIEDRYDTDDGPGACDRPKPNAWMQAGALLDALEAEQARRFSETSSELERCKSLRADTQEKWEKFQPMMREEFAKRDAYAELLLRVLRQAREQLFYVYDGERAVSWGECLKAIDDAFAAQDKLYQMGRESDDAKNAARWLAVRQFISPDLIDTWRRDCPPDDAGMADEAVDHLILERDDLADHAQMAAAFERIDRDVMTESPAMSAAHEHTFCPHCKPCRHAPKLDELDALRGAMVGLASRYGNGPGGGEFTTLEDMTERITEGVDSIVRVEVGRATPATSAAEMVEARDGAFRDWLRIRAPHLVGDAPIDVLQAFYAGWNAAHKAPAQGVEK